MPPTRWPTTGGRPGSPPATASRSWRATTAGSSSPPTPLLAAAPGSCSSTPTSPDRRSATWRRARAPTSSSTTTSTATSWPMSRPGSAGSGRGPTTLPSAATDTIAGVVATGDTSAAPRSGVDPKVVLLTSGTTGTPKGAPRAEPRSLAPIGALLSRVPFNAKGVLVLPAPMFHTLGFAQALLNGFLGSTLVVRRRFDPALVLQDLSVQPRDRHGRRAGDAAEDGRARRRGVRRGRPQPADGDLRRGLPARRRARDPVDRAVRPGHPQHVRIDRGRLRDHRDAGGPGRRARLRRPAGDGRRGQALRRRTARRSRRSARPAGSSSATTSSSRATPAAATRTGSTG